MLVKIFSGAVNGIEATTITLEVNILSGAKFCIVGLPDNAVKESQQRIVLPYVKLVAVFRGKGSLSTWLLLMSKKKAPLMIFR